MSRIPGSILSAEARRLADVDARLPRRHEEITIAGAPLKLETLDDLDAAIDQLTRSITQASGVTASGAVAEMCPHFGVVWPAAIALAEHLAERLSSSAGVIKSPLDILELGCGLAIPSMIARRHGCGRVVATDRHPLVELFLKRNVAANGLDSIEYRHLDWRKSRLRDGEASPVGRFDLVIGSDLLYEPWQPAHLAEMLPTLLVPGGEALIADPGRRYVDAFVSLLEAKGYSCDLAEVRPVRSGGSSVDVLLVSVR